ncbi:TolC family protein [Xylophilus sp. GOD-11R]|uniref:TolC family protein n=1 Tax=Xylophilus sp. GOD-11R TaxID=3089814 RepID=UPI00298D3255|nr:TolC family protein [Xylophilus sp. GOD-11R]WPB56212.1 TolC family protein [Xylophilus sp. GOD-11R]
MSHRLFRARGALALLAAGCIAQPAAAQFALQPQSATERPAAPAPVWPAVRPAPTPAAQPAASAPANAPTAPRRGTDAPPLNLPAAAASGAAVTASLETGARINLQQLTDAIVQNNTGLLSAQRLRNTAQAAINSAGAFPNPRLEYSAGNQSARQVGGVGGNVSTYGISQLIENPWLREARVDAARFGERASTFQVGVTRNELVAQVRLRAYDLLLRQAEAAAAAEASSLLEQVNTRVRARVDSGEAPRYELIKADAETVNARSLQQTALLQAQQAAITLNRLGAGTLPPQWSLDAALSETPRPMPDMNLLREQMLARNPELMTLRAEVDRARAQLDLAEAGRLPGVELRLSQSREPDVKQNIFGVTLQIPLFDRRTGPIAEAGSELERARGRLDGRQAELEQQLQAAEKALEMARLRIEALSQGAVRDAEAALRVADAAWRFGERGILDVLDSQRVLRAVRADLLTARFQAQAARTELDFLSGRWADDTPPLPSAALQRGGMQ